jgi:hypothetical protein
MIYFKTPNLPDQRYGIIRKAFKQLNLKTKFIRDISFVNREILELTLEENYQDHCIETLNEAGWLHLRNYDPLVETNVLPEVSIDKFVNRMSGLMEQAVSPRVTHSQTNPKPRLRLAKRVSFSVEIYRPKVIYFILWSASFWVSSLRLHFRLECFNC